MHTTPSAKPLPSCSVGLLRLTFAVAWLAVAYDLTGAVVAPCGASAQQAVPRGTAPPVPAGSVRTAPASPRSAGRRAASAARPDEAAAPPGPAATTPTAADAAAGGRAEAAAETNAPDRPASDIPQPTGDRIGGPPLATDADEAVPPAGVRAAERRRASRSADDDRERWRLPSDLVNPFLDDFGDRFDGDASRWGDDDDEDWYVFDEELVDPWSGARRHAPFGVWRCRGARRVAAREPSARLTAPRSGLRRAVRSSSARRVELGAFVGVGTVGDDGRPRLEMQATVRLGALGLPFSVLTSAGKTRGTIGSATTLREVGHARHAVTVGVEHRLTDGRAALDLGVQAGVMLSELGEDVRLLPLGRATLTGGVRLGESVDFLVRAEGGTTFVRPGDFLLGGPSAFEAALAIGLRVGARLSVAGRRVRHRRRATASGRSIPLRRSARGSLL